MVGGDKGGRLLRWANLCRVCQSRVRLTVAGMAYLTEFHGFSGVAGAARRDSRDSAGDHLRGAVVTTHFADSTDHDIIVNDVAQVTVGTDNEGESDELAQLGLRARRVVDGANLGQVAKHESPARQTPVLREEVGHLLDQVSAKGTGRIFQNTEPRHDAPDETPQARDNFRAAHGDDAGQELHRAVSDVGDI